MLFRSGTPPDIVKKLNIEIGKVMRLPEVQERVLSQGGEPATGSPEEFGAFIKAELVKWAKVVKESGAQVD